MKKSVCKLKRQKALFCNAAFTLLLANSSRATLEQCGHFSELKIAASSLATNEEFMKKSVCKLKAYMKARKALFRNATFTLLLANNWRELLNLYKLSKTAHKLQCRCDAVSISEQLANCLRAVSPSVDPALRLQLATIFQYDQLFPTNSDLFLTFRFLAHRLFDYLTIRLFNCSAFSTIQQVSLYNHV